MRISSPMFEDGGIIPEKYTREGGNKWPTLNFDAIPSSAQSLALVMDNPDTVKGTFTHWIVFNLSPAMPGLNENVPPTVLHQGRNDCGQSSYSGPKCPSADHHYFFRLYALDDKLPFSHGMSRLDLEEAMIGHVIAEAECQGHFAAPVEVAA